MRKILVLLMLVNSVLSAQVSISWQKTIGGTNNDFPSYVAQINDGSYIVAGKPGSVDGDFSQTANNNGNWIGKVSESGFLSTSRTVNRDCGSCRKYISSITATSDGGFIIAGNTSLISNFQNYTDSWIIKYNSSMTVQWEKTYEFQNNTLVTTNSITETDSGYVLTGRYWYNTFILKISFQGDELIRKTLSPHTNNNLGNGQSPFFYGKSIQPTSDGGYIFLGSKNTVSFYHNNVQQQDASFHNSPFADAFVIKFSNTFEIEWKKSYGGFEREDASKILQTLDGGYVIVGSTNSNDGDVSGNNGSYDGWIVKLGSSGQIEWQNSLGGTNPDYLFDISENENGGYVIVGSTNSNDGDVSGNNGSSDGWIVKLGSSGEIVWQKCIGGSNSESIYNFSKTADGGYITQSRTNSNDDDVSGNNGLYDFWTVKIILENVAPEVVDDTFTVSEDSGLTNMEVVSNDTDVDGDTLTVTSFSYTGAGTVAINADNTSIDYTPFLDFNGVEEITYTVSDGTLTDTGILTVTVTSENDAPEVVDDTFTVSEDSGLTNKEVVSNDTDVDGDTLTVTSFSYTGAGTVAINADNTSIDYTPFLDFNGVEEITYTVSDGTLTDTGILTVTVTSENDAPEALDDTFTLQQGNTEIVTLIATDVDDDDLTFSILSDPSHGSVAIDGNQATYIADSGYSGSDSFTFSASDGFLNSNEATMSIDVTLDLIDNQLDNIKTYPNPFERIYFIDSPIELKLEVYDINGRMLLNKNLEIGENKIDLSRLSNGFYIFKYIDQNRTMSKVIIKK